MAISPEMSDGSSSAHDSEGPTTPPQDHTDELDNMFALEFPGDTEQYAHLPLDQFPTLDFPDLELPQDGSFPDLPDLNANKAPIEDAWAMPESDAGMLMLATQSENSALEQMQTQPMGSVEDWGTANSLTDANGLFNMSLSENTNQAALQSTSMQASQETFPAAQDKGFPAASNTTLATPQRTSSPTSNFASTPASHIMSSPLSLKNSSPATQFTNTETPQCVSTPTPQYKGSPAVQYMNPAAAQYMNPAATQYMNSPAAQYMGAPFMNSPAAQYMGAQFMNSPAAQYMGAQFMNSPAAQNMNPAAAQYMGAQFMNSPAAQYMNTPAAHFMNTSAAQVMGSPAAQYMGAPATQHMESPAAQSMGPPATYHNGSLAAQNMRSVPNPHTSSPSTQYVGLGAVQLMSPTPTRPMQTPLTRYMSPALTERTSSSAIHPSGSPAAQYQKPNAGHCVKPFPALTTTPAPNQLMSFPGLHRMASGAPQLKKRSPSKTKKPQVPAQGHRRQASSESSAERPQKVQRTNNATAKAQQVNSPIAKAQAANFVGQNGQSQFPQQQVPRLPLTKAQPIHCVDPSVGVVTQMPHQIAPKPAYEGGAPSTTQQLPKQSTSVASSTTSSVEHQPKVDSPQPSKAATPQTSSVKALAPTPGQQQSLAMAQVPAPSQPLLATSQMKPSPAPKPIQHSSPQPTRAVPAVPQTYAPPSRPPVMPAPQPDPTNMNIGLIWSKARSQFSADQPLKISAYGAVAEGETDMRAVLLVEDISGNLQVVCAGSPGFNWLDCLRSLAGEYVGRFY